MSVTAHRQTRAVRALLSISALVLGAPALLAQGRVIPRPCPVPPACARGDCSLPIPVIECNGRVGAPRVERTDTRVRVTLADRVLRYEVTETFRNVGGNLGEADYLFPLPTGAAFEDLRLMINGELVAGETMDAERARGEYERIVRQMRDPALVEWMGSGLLRTRIFPFGAGESRTVSVRYQQVAPREGDALRVEFRRTADDSTSGAHAALQLELPMSGYGDPWSPTHDLSVRRDGDRRVVDVRGRARDVVVLIPTPRSQAAAVSVLTNASGPRERFALITVAPPAERTARTSRDVTFVLDVSGSMQGGKLAQAKAAGRQLLESLDRNDRFRLVDFSTDVHSFRDDYLPASRENVSSAERYLDELRAEGSTNISGALANALDAARRNAATRLQVVVFVTDGEPTVGMRNPDAIADSVRAWHGDVRLFTFGLGADVNATLVERIALEGRGLAHFVRPDENVERMVSLVAERLQRPLVTDVRIEGEGVRLVQQYPAQSSDLFAGQELVVLARYEGDGPGAIRVTGRSADGRVEWRSPVTFPERSSANAFVPRLWATQRVGWLSAERRRNGASPELDDELRSLGTRYGIPTELTSYFVREPVALGNAPMRDDAAMRRASGINGALQGRVAGAPMPATAAAAADLRFEQAKTASAQRSATSIAALDSLVAATATREQRAGDGQKQASGRTFVRMDGGWIESRLAGGKPSAPFVVRVQAYSAAWFAVLRVLPELRDALALGDRVQLTGNAVVLQVTPNGNVSLDDATLARLKSAW